MAKVNSCAACSHCWAASYCIPRLKFLSPFFANAVNGAASKQKITRSDANGRRWMDDFIFILSSGAGSSLPSRAIQSLNSNATSVETPRDGSLCANLHALQAAQFRKAVVGGQWSVSSEFEISNLR